ncbi:hypothetical protein PRIPAC_97881 [Pristionchus pacificus]|uniref:RING-type domain-containing protein n=1 Tax=Pristionchus pacificus TaxID=54126 RepID=A0A2A6B2I3_PRIPA|nr:hypothetical protein PRIPAC_97881 [Pristionchus pacificus]|eukprot:PDM60085.1 hypothetical protein PRIPAC_49371 [Pristionchus pacificus]
MPPRPTAYEIDYVLDRMVKFLSLSNEFVFSAYLVSWVGYQAKTWLPKRQFQRGGSTWKSDLLDSWLRDPTTNRMPEKRALYEADPKSFWPFKRAYRLSNGQLIEPRVMSSPRRIPAVQRPAPQVRRPQPPAASQQVRPPSQRVQRARAPVQQVQQVRQTRPLIVRGNLVIAPPVQQAPQHAQPVQQAPQHAQPVQQAPQHAQQVQRNPLPVQHPLVVMRMLSDVQKKRRTDLEEQLKKVNESENKKKYSRECAICYHPNPIERSVTSKCGHTCCTRCMIRQEQTEGVFKGRIDCPFCRTRTAYTKLFESEVDENDVEKVQNRKRSNGDSGEDMPSKRTRCCSNSW